MIGFSNEQAIATYIDGVYQFYYFSAPPLFNDIQSIEILRGPRGTLYGCNAFGGVVILVINDFSSHCAVL
ncbi:TonB-dependent receptor plug domain-containing protein [Mucilaginibacter lappiensis]|uniref:TonB-dependent receptor plug domain-containing protein n=1 Tax=Mucilaginibacter lappiensis TaxID=354630 RepID=UPI001FED25D8|nr:Plug domain-containing protein [Mucilaginibacter lappiensis]